MFDGGTLSTPTIDGDFVYTVSHQGDLFCIALATGQPVWYKHYQQDFQGRRPDYGFAGSPLVEGGLLILDVGGRGASTVALDKATGATVWKSGDDAAGYSTPIAADLAGQRTIILFKAGHVVGLEAQTGRELWRQKWKTEGGTNVATPLVIDQRLFISSGYGRGCGLFDIINGAVSQRWQNVNLKAHLTAPIFWQGAIYGIDGQASPRGQLVCLDPETGSLKWAEKVGGGSFVIADGKFILVSELGELFIGDATQTGFQPTVRQQVLGSRCWTTPTMANGRIFCRNNKGDLVALGVMK
jgi:outer membrane protein assembly factor BamB